MSVTRRTFIKSVAASTALAATSSSLIGAATTKVWAQSSLALGGVKIDVLSDGNLRLPTAMLMANAPKEEVAAYFAKHKLSMEALEPSCNLTLLRDGERTILFDVGSGPNFMPSAGKLADAMDAIELDPADVTHVVFTHAHPDHLWGLMDDFDEPLFSEAQYMISKTEWDFWIDKETVNKIGEARQVFAVGAMRNLKAIEDKITRFNFEDEILPGVRAFDTSGHTPGHTSFEIRSGGESVVVVGDVLTNPFYSFEKPHWPSGSDQDYDGGITARKSLLDQLEHGKMQMIGYHIPYPGIGRVERNGNEFKFVAA